MNSRLSVSLLSSAIVSTACSGALVDYAQREVQCPDDDTWAESPYTDGATYFKGLCPGECIETLPHCDLFSEQVCRKPAGQETGECVDIDDADAACSALADAELPVEPTDGLFVFDARFAERDPDEADAGQRCGLLRFGAWDELGRLPIFEEEGDDPPAQALHLATSPDSTPDLYTFLAGDQGIDDEDGIEWTVYVFDVCFPAGEFPSELVVQFQLESGAASNRACVLPTSVDEICDEALGLLKYVTPGVCASG